MKNEINIIMTTMFVIFFFNCYFAIDAECASDNESAKYILNKIADNRNKIENFKCINEKLMYQSSEDQQSLYRQLLEAGLSKEFLESRLEQNYKYQTDYLAYDNKGSGRVEIISEKADEKGNKTGNITGKLINTWDGNNSIYYNEYLELTTATIGRIDIPKCLTNSYMQPWRTFGGNFFDSLAQAIDEEEVINIEKQNNGQFKVEFIKTNNKKIIAIIDPNQGYSIVSQEIYNEDGSLNRTYNALFEEVQSGIWFPVSGECITGNLDNPNEKDTMTISEIKINDPNFYDGLYHIEFPDGTYVTDVATGLLYVVGKPMSTTTDGVSKTLDEVALGTLEDIAQQPELMEVFIPKADIALEDNEAFVLCFSDGKLVNTNNHPESEESDRFLAELARGDIAWDGEIVSVRSASVLTTKQNAEEPLESTAGKWNINYKLPEEVQLPYSLLVVTKEKDNYLVNIKEIKGDGVHISYRKLNSGEIDIYKPAN